MLDKRPSATAEICATSVVPAHGHANSIRACDVIQRAGNKRRARCVDIQRLEREPIRPWACLYAAATSAVATTSKGKVATTTATATPAPNTYRFETLLRRSAAIRGIVSDRDCLRAQRLFWAVSQRGMTSRPYEGARVTRTR